MSTSVQRVRFAGRPVPAVRPSKRARLAWAVTGVLLPLAETAIVVVTRKVDALYDADPHWFTATYAEPWRTVAFAVVILSSCGAATRIALGRRYPSPRRLYGTAARLLAGFAVCLELTTTVHFNDALGELYVHTFVHRRSKISFRKGTRGWCVNADLRKPFVWRLNGKALHPRLMPLPYDAARLAHGLSSSSGSRV
jgi:hypothetical protein